MISTKQTKLSSRTDARLVAYAAVAGSALAASTAATTKAAIVYSGPVNIAVPDTFDGIYLNLVTGETGVTTDPAVAFDINLYDVNGLDFAANYFFDGSSGILVDLGTINASALTPGYLIGPSVNVRNVYEAGTYGYNFQVTGTELLGLRFLNETTGASDYGWVELSTTSDTGFPATITGYAYDDSGAAIPAGAVPEPTTTALLGVMAVGAVGVRQWRKRHASRQTA